MKKIIMISMILVLFTLLFILVYNVSATDTWYNDNWNYRKSLTLTGKQLGEQTLLIVGNTTGGNITCSSHVMNDFRDLRFTDISCNLLPYWIENYTTSIRANVWINNSLNVSTIYMYYGNHGATSISNGNTTFYFFDHFNGSSLNTHKWTVVNSPTTSISSSELTIQNSGAGSIDGITALSNTFGKHYSIRTRMKAVAGSRSIGFGFDEYSAPALHNFMAYENGGSTYMALYWDDGVGAIQGGTVNVYSTSYQLFDMIRNTSNVITYVNSVKKVDSGVNEPTTSLSIKISENNAKSLVCKGVFDWIFLMKYWDILPYWSAFGIEEQQQYDDRFSVSYIYPSNNSVNIPVCPTLEIHVNNRANRRINITWAVWDFGFVANVGLSNNMDLFSNLGVPRNDTYYFTYRNTLINCFLTNTWYYWFINVSDGKFYHKFPEGIHMGGGEPYRFKTKTINGSNITFIDNHINTSHSHNTVWLSNSTWKVFDNDTGNANIFHISLNLLGVIGFINWSGDILSTSNNISFNVTSNMTINGTANINATDVWLYLGAMLSFDNGQFFLIILIGLWTYFIYLFYKEKEVIFSFAIICCGLPLGLILSGVAYYNSYPFGYLVSLIVIIISFLIPSYSLYQKNKKKK